MKTQTRVATRTGPIGRGPKVRAAVLAATLAELAETGYAALTIETVAQRAGVHKTTVYRRWKDRETLVSDAVTDHVASDIPIPDTGTIEDDLRELARLLIEAHTRPMGQAILAALYSDAARLPEVTEVRRHLFADRFRRAEPVVTRAVQRGHLPAATDPTLLIKSLIAPIYLRLLVTSEPIDDTTAEHAAELTLAAARAGVFRVTEG